MFRSKQSVVFSASYCHWGYTSSPSLTYPWYSESICINGYFRTRSDMLSKCQTQHRTNITVQKVAAFYSHWHSIYEHICRRILTRDICRLVRRRHCTRAPGVWSACASTCLSPPPIAAQSSQTTHWQGRRTLTFITGYNQSVTGCGSQRRQCSFYSTKTHVNHWVQSKRHRLWFSTKTV